MAEVIGEIIIYGFILLLTAGLYALLYGLGKIFNKKYLVNFSYLFAGAQFMSGIAMITPDFFTPFWKVTIMICIIAYLFVPQAMWFFVTKIHSYHED